MTPLRPVPVAFYRPLCAGLVAAHLVFCLSGTALAQSAEDEKVIQDQFAQPTSADKASPTDPAAADDDENGVDENGDPSTSTTTSSTAANDSTIEDPQDLLDQEALQEIRRQNMRETTLDGLKLKPDAERNDVQGVKVGSFTLRPSLTETIGIERTKTGSDSTTRTYLRSGLKGTLTSNWSLHQLTINGEGTWDKTFSGIPNDDPEGKIDATLRFDLTDETTATLKAGYSLEREDIGDPNAISNAAVQSDVQQYTATAELTRDLGVLRTTAGLDFTREVYGNAILENGNQLSQADRNQNTGVMRGRLGYELSPALIPFIEASYGKMIYDNHQDSLGFVRDAQLYSAKAGVEVDLGEKLRGELAGGYTIADFDDAALKTISAATIDGNAVWSPQRGTDIALNLKTEIEPSTTAGASGDVAYSATAVLSQVILENLTGQISSGFTLRDYSESTTSRQSVLALGTGLTWGISRSLDFNTDIAWEKTQQESVPTLDILRAGVSLTLKR